MPLSVFISLCPDIPRRVAGRLNQMRPVPVAVRQGNMLMPGQQTTWTVRWYLVPYKMKKPTPSQDLLNKVRSIIK